MAHLPLTSNKVRRSIRTAHCRRSASMAYHQSASLKQSFIPAAADFLAAQHDDITPRLQQAYII